MCDLVIKKEIIKKIMKKQSPVLIMFLDREFQEPFIIY